MTVPVVSILMPVRNEEEYLGAALSSLYRQTLTEWELIAVDDHSVDATSHILAEAAQHDTRVRVLQPADAGLVGALNTGLSACRAPFVARMDGDDISHPRRLEKQYELMRLQPEIGLLACSFRHFPRNAVRDGMRGYEQWQNSLVCHHDILQDLYVESPFVHPSVMYRRELVERIGGYRDMEWAEDYDLWLRLAASGARFARLQESLFFWREHSRRATRTMRAYSSAAFRNCKAHHLRNSFLEGQDQVILAGAGLEGRAWRRTLVDIGVRVGLWVDVDPKKTGRELHGAPVLSAAEVKADGRRMLVTVGTRGSREGVRQWAAGAGFVEGVDFVCVT